MAQRPSDKGAVIKKVEVLPTSVEFKHTFVIGRGQVGAAGQGGRYAYVRVESADGGRYLIVTTHGDFERFVRELSRRAERAELPAPSGPPTPEQIQALGAAAMRHNGEIVGPPLT